MGNRTAFSVLYDRYGRAMYSVIFDITQSSEDAENLLQDAFVKVWHNIHRYDATKGRLYTWLVVIARRLALDFVRSAYFAGKQKIQNLDVAVSVESASTEMARLEHIGVETALTQLTPNLRQVIDLQYFMGYTQQEVADETGLPLGTVKTRTRAALLLLKKALDN